MCCSFQVSLAKAEKPIVQETCLASLGLLFSLNFATVSQNIATLLPNLGHRKLVFLEN